MNNLRCPVGYVKCDYCSCTGKACQDRFRGLKVEWPELQGVSAIEAKKIIEKDNPRVVAFIVPESLFQLQIICCNRVFLYVPDENCPYGPVLNRPRIG